MAEGGGLEQGRRRKECAGRMAAWLLCLAAGRHSDISPPAEGPEDRIISAVAFSKCWLCG